MTEEKKCEYVFAYYKFDLAQFKFKTVQQNAWVFKLQKKNENSKLNGECFLKGPSLQQACKRDKTNVETFWHFYFVSYFCPFFFISKKCLQFINNNKSLCRYFTSFLQLFLQHFTHRIFWGKYKFGTKKNVTVELLPLLSYRKKERSKDGRSTSKLKGTHQIKFD